MSGRLIGRKLSQGFEASTQNLQFQTQDGLRWPGGNVRLAAYAGDGATLFLDVPAANDAARQLAAELGMTPVFETARMYTGEPPAVDVSKLFGVTSFELG